MFDSVGESWRGLERVGVCEGVLRSVGECWRVLESVGQCVGQCWTVQCWGSSRKCWIVLYSVGQCGECWGSVAFCYELCCLVL